MSRDELERMEREHVRKVDLDHDLEFCASENCYRSDESKVEWPCDAAKAIARVRALEAGLARYGAHEPQCAFWANPGSAGYVFGCSCGLAALADGEEDEGEHESTRDSTPS